MGTVAQRPWDLGILYAASGVPMTYVDAKGVTQAYAGLVNAQAYTPMTTVQGGGVDTSKPYAGSANGLTLSVECSFGTVTSYTIKLQCKRDEETQWKDLQIALQSDPGTVAASQTISAGSTAVVFQTASVYSVQQIRIVLTCAATDNTNASDGIVIRGQVQ